MNSFGPFQVYVAFVTVEAYKFNVPPAQIGPLFDAVGADGAALTVSVALLEIALPYVLPNVARYWLPLSDTSAVNASVVFVSPFKWLNVAPLSVLTCHCIVGSGPPLIVGSGPPLAAAVKLAIWPTHTLWFVGCVVITGGMFPSARLCQSPPAIATTFVRPEGTSVWP